MAEETKTVGYNHNLSPAQVDLINQTKILREQIRRHIEVLRECKDFSQRDLAAGWTQIQSGFFFVVNAIADPPRVELPGDELTLDTPTQA